MAMASSSGLSSDATKDGSETVQSSGSSDITTNLPTAVIVLGMAGSGKSTLMQVPTFLSEINSYLRYGRTVNLINIISISYQYHYLIYQVISILTYN